MAERRGCALGPAGPINGGECLLQLPAGIVQRLPLIASRWVCFAHGMLRAAFCEAPADPCCAQGMEVGV